MARRGLQVFHSMYDFYKVHILHVSQLLLQCLRLGLKYYCSSIYQTARSYWRWPHILCAPTKLPPPKTIAKTYFAKKSPYTIVLVHLILHTALKSRNHLLVTGYRHFKKLPNLKFCLTASLMGNWKQQKMEMEMARYLTSYLNHHKLATTVLTAAM